jgi:hypothetical protein
MGKEDIATHELPSDCSEGILAVLDKSGDTEVRWNRNREAEVEAARTTFDSLRAKGYMAYRMTASGSRGEVIREFDPTAERIILAPQMVGG